MSYEYQDARLRVDVVFRNLHLPGWSAASHAHVGAVMNWWIKVLLLAGVFTLPLWPAVNVIATLEVGTQLGCITDYECEVLGND